MKERLARMSDEMKEIEDMKRRRAEGEGEGEPAPKRMKPGHDMGLEGEAQIVGDIDMSLKGKGQADQATAMDAEGVDTQLALYRPVPGEDRAIIGEIGEAEADVATEPGVSPEDEADADMATEGKADADMATEGKADADLAVEGQAEPTAAQKGQAKPLPPWKYKSPTPARDRWFIENGMMIPPKPKPPGPIPPTPPPPARLPIGSRSRAGPRAMASPMPPMPRRPKGPAMARPARPDGSPAMVRPAIPHESRAMLRPARGSPKTPPGPPPSPAKALPTDAEESWVPGTSMKRLGEMLDMGRVVWKRRWPQTPLPPSLHPVDGPPRERDGANIVTLLHKCTSDVVIGMPTLCKPMAKGPKPTPRPPSSPPTAKQIAALKLYMAELETAAAEATPSTSTPQPKTPPWRKGVPRQPPCEFPTGRKGIPQQPPCEFPTEEHATDEQEGTVKVDGMGEEAAQEEVHKGEDHGGMDEDDGGKDIPSEGDGGSDIPGMDILGEDDSDMDIPGMDIPGVDDGGMYIPGEDDGASHVEGGEVWT